MIRAFLKKVGLLANKVVGSKVLSEGAVPRIIPRKDHTLSRANISENALKVLYRLHQHGFEAYLVGGGVRDLLLGLYPKDFDVVTNAKPEEIRRVFRNCRLIGRRFRLAHVFFGHDIIEVATFRGKALASTTDADHSHSSHGIILRDNVYGTLAEDAWRRDFTINALYYNIADFSVVDYTNGYADLKAKKLRMIGDVVERFREDPMRMLRAVRIAAKVNFELPLALTQAFLELRELISHISGARLFEEIVKMFHSGDALMVYEQLKKHHLFEPLFPSTYQYLQNKLYPTDELLKSVFKNTDLRISQDKPVTPAFIIAALLWHPICARTQHYIDKGMAFLPARDNAIEENLHELTRRLSIPKRLTQGAREIWVLQIRLANRSPKRVHRVFSELRFRAAYDFLELRAKAGEDIAELANWWAQYIDADSSQRNALLKTVSSGYKTKKKRRKVSKKPPSGIDD